MRGIAASAVALAHVDPRFHVGAIGVDIFFVVSGFVMTRACQARTPSQFLIDRIWRIFPLYWIVSLPFIVTALAAGAIPLALAVNSMLLLPRWFGFDSSFIGVSWTLVYELAFYGAMATAMKLRSTLVPLSLFAVAVVGRPFVDHPLIQFAGHPIAMEFLFGIVVAQSRRDAKLGRGLLVVGLLWLLMFPNAQLHDFFGDGDEGYGLRRLALWGIPAALIIYGIVSLEEKLASRTWTRPLLLLGAASYSIYLVHNIVIRLVVAPWPIEWLASLAAGILLWHSAERPILQYRARLQGRMIQKGDAVHPVPVG